jgi:hypothetical protein
MTPRWSKRFLVNPHIFVCESYRYIVGQFAYVCFSNMRYKVRAVSYLHSSVIETAVHVTTVAMTPLCRVQLAAKNSDLDHSRRFLTNLVAQRCQWHHKSVDLTKTVSFHFFKKRPKFVFSAREEPDKGFHFRIVNYVEIETSLETSVGDPNSFFRIRIHNIFFGYGFGFGSLD